MSPRVARMRELTRAAHGRQTRNGGRIPYWVHTDNVADIVRRAVEKTGEPADAEDLVLAAYGHDLYEDTAVTPDDIRRLFGPRVDELIAGMTNRIGDHDRDEYLRHIAAADDEVRVIKCADLVDNMLSVAYGLHDLGLGWTRTFFLPIAAETREVLAGTEFARLPRLGAHLLDLVEWGWTRLSGAVDTATGQEWAGDEKTEADMSNDDGTPTEDEYEALRRRLTFTPEEAERAREAQRREEEERRRRLFGDAEPFAIPDTDTDA